MINVCICMRSNPSLRPPSKPPLELSSPATGTPRVKMLMVLVGPVSSFDFTIYHDCEEVFDFAIYSDCKDEDDIDMFMHVRNLQN